MKELTNRKSKAIEFSLENGLSPNVETTKRMLSAMEGMYLDNEELLEMIRTEDILVYEFYQLGVPEKDSDLSYGTTILYPGKVGTEYFMTKGHFHSILATAEVYFCIRGEGYLLMENMNGDSEIQRISPGISVYVPPKYAHRSINTSNSESLIMFFVFRADAGHDYKTIETKGFRKLVVEKDGKTQLIDNPKWKE